MPGDISAMENIYKVCGYTDLRLVIDRLTQLVQRQFRMKLEPEQKKACLEKERPILRTF